jgi:hypothetical protein
MSERSLEDLIAEVLREGGWVFRQQVPIAGARADFVVWLGDRPFVGLEAKAFRVGIPAGSIRTGSLFAMELAGAFGLPVLVVIPDALAELADGTNVVTPASLVARLDRLAREARSKRPSATVQPAGTRTVFCAMPFADELGSRRLGVPREQMIWWPNESITMNMRRPTLFGRSRRRFEDRPL